MCLECGFYKGRQVIDLAARKEAREARLQAKREAIKGQQAEAAAALETADAPAETLPDTQAAEDEVAMKTAKKEAAKAKTR